MQFGSGKSTWKSGDLIAGRGYLLESFSCVLRSIYYDFLWESFATSQYSIGSQTGTQTASSLLETAIANEGSVKFVLVGKSWSSDEQRTR